MVGTLASAPDGGMTGSRGGVRDKRGMASTVAGEKKVVLMVLWVLGVLGVLRGVLGLFLMSGFFSLISKSSDTSDP